MNDYNLCPINNRVLIHIGYHKTGTSWMQYHIFTSNEVFEPFSLTSSGISTIAPYFILDKNGNFLSKHNYNKHYINNLIENILNFKNFTDKIPVISFEGLSGHPYYIDFDAKPIANRLNNTFPNALIFIVIRKQNDFIISNYFQYIKEGGTKNFNKFLNAEINNEKYGQSFKYIDYISLIKEYYKLFKRDNVLVLPYEMFKYESFMFFNKLSKFIGKEIKINSNSLSTNINKNKYPFIHYYLYRILNKLLIKNNSDNLFNKKLKNVFAVLSGGLSHFIPNNINIYLINKLYDQLDNYINDKYAMYNKELSELIGIDLKKYNY